MQPTKSSLIDKMNRAVLALLLIVVIAVSGFYVLNTVKNSTNNNFAENPASVVQKPVDNEDKASLLSVIQNASKSNIVESKRLDTLKAISINKNFKVEDKQNTLNSLK